MIVLGLGSDLIDITRIEKSITQLCQALCCEGGLRQGARHRHRWQSRLA